MPEFSSSDVANKTRISFVNVSEKIKNTMSTNVSQDLEALLIRETTGIWERGKQIQNAKGIRKVRGANSAGMDAIYANTAGLEYKKTLSWSHPKAQRIFSLKCWRNPI